MLVRFTSRWLFHWLIALIRTGWICIFSILNTLKVLLHLLFPLFTGSIKNKTRLQASTAQGQSRCFEIVFSYPCLRAPICSMHLPHSCNEYDSIQFLRKGLSRNHVSLFWIFSDTPSHVTLCRQSAISLALKVNKIQEIIKKWFYVTKCFSTPLLLSQKTSCRFFSNPPPAPCGLLGFWTTPKICLQKNKK